MRIFNVPNGTLSNRDRTFLSMNYYSLTPFDLKLSSGDDDPQDLGSFPVDNSITLLNLTSLKILKTVLNVLRK